MIFLDLGTQPLANNFLKSLNKQTTRYRLLVDFEKKTSLVSIKKKFQSAKMFNNKYPYRSSLSKTMNKNFKDLSKNIIKKFKPKKILEIGCNDGIFLKNFKNIKKIGIEPCKNIAQLAKMRNINVYEEYWNRKLSRKLKKKYDDFDLIYSANTITHINNLDEVFEAVNYVMKDNGILIIEDPSLLNCIKNVSYDQFYNEHIYVFSLISLKNILKKHHLEIFNVENLKVHGGSNRYFIKKINNNNIKIDKSVSKNYKKEIKFKLHKYSTYKKFGLKVINSKKLLISIFRQIRKLNHKIIGYGATAKSVTVLNYCEFAKKDIKYFLDTTPEKKNKFIPGTNIKVKKYTKNSLKNIKYVFLGAWNFKKEIFKKESKFINKGGKFITHVPFPKII